MDTIDAIEIGDIFRVQRIQIKHRALDLDNAMGLRGLLALSDRSIPGELLDREAVRKYLEPMWDMRKPTLRDELTMEMYNALPDMYVAARACALTPNEGRAVMRGEYERGYDKLSEGVAPFAYYLRWHFMGKQRHATQTMLGFSGFAGNLRAAGALGPLIALWNIEYQAINIWLQLMGLTTAPSDLRRMAHELEPKVRPLKEYLVPEYVKRLPSSDPEVYTTWAWM